MHLDATLGTIQCGLWTTASISEIATPAVELESAMVLYQRIAFRSHQRQALSLMRVLTTSTAMNIVRHALRNGLTMNHASHAKQVTISSKILASKLALQIM